MTQTAPHIFPAVQRLEIRALRRSDRDRLEEAFYALSEQSRYERFLGPKPRLTSRELDRLVDLDHVTHDALAAFDRLTGRLVGVARYAAYPDDESVADVAITIADDWQGRGLGSLLLGGLVERAAANGLARLSGTVLAENHRSLGLLRKLGFRATGRDAYVIELALELEKAAIAA